MILYTLPFTCQLLLCLCLEQGLSTFLVLRPFNAVPHGVVTRPPPQDYFVTMS